jgi:hypothetical protein
MELDEGSTYVAPSTGILETEQQHCGVPDASTILNNELLDHEAIQDIELPEHSLYSGGTN